MLLYVQIIQQEFRMLCACTSTSYTIYMAKDRAHFRFHVIATVHGHATEKKNLEESRQNTDEFYRVTKQEVFVFVKIQTCSKKLCQ